MSETRPKSTMIVLSKQIKFVEESIKNLQSEYNYLTEDINEFDCPISQDRQLTIEGRIMELDNEMCILNDAKSEIWQFKCNMRHDLLTKCFINEDKLGDNRE